jgi:PHD and RING finger domain-containing protein 1
MSIKKLRAAELKAEMMEEELHNIKKLMKNEAANRECERAFTRMILQQLEESETLLHEVITEYLLDDSSTESASECDDDDNDDDDDDDDDGDGPDEEGDIHFNGEIQEWAEENSEEAGTSSCAAAISDNNETTICDGGAAFSPAAPPAVNMSDGSTEGQAEMCPICLCGFVTQEVGTPEACNHSFCADCLQEWLKNTNACPLDRQVCDTILVRRSVGGEVVRRVHVEPPSQQEEDVVIDYVIYCEVCGGCNHFHPVILCGRCGRGYHLDCVYLRLDTVTQEEWFCSDCA